MLVVVQNDPEVPPGLLMELARKKGIPCRVLRLFDGDGFDGLANAGGMIVLGGRMSVEDTAEFPLLQLVKEQVKVVVEKQIPFLGICLGGQLLAEMLGARVSLQRRGEQGCRQIQLTAAGEQDRLLRGLPNPFFSFQWHSDSFELPPGGVHLASSHVCPYQAFRFGAAAYGIQFHPEVTKAIVRVWSAEEEDSESRFLNPFIRMEPAHRAASLALLGNFLEML